MSLVANVAYESIDLTLIKFNTSVFQDMEDAEGRRAACRAALHCQLTRPRAGDREIVVYQEFAAGERDRLAFERGIELNRVSIAGRSDRTAQ